MDKLFVAYCNYHHWDLTMEDIKRKKCKFKPNTKARCRHLYLYKIKEKCIKRKCM